MSFKFCSSRVFFIRNLKKLILIFVKISLINLNKLLKIFTINCFLDKLVISSVQLDMISCNLLNTFIKQEYNIRYLDLSGNQLNSYSLFAIFDNISSNTFLQYLNLSNLPFGQNDLESFEKKSKLINSLNKFIKNSKNLIHIDLSSSLFHRQSIYILADTLSKHENLSFIHLEGNQINEGVKKELDTIFNARKFKYQKFINIINENV